MLFLSKKKDNDMFDIPKDKLEEHRELYLKYRKKGMTGNQAFDKATKKINRQKKG